MRKLLADIFCVAIVLCMVACSEGDDDGGVYIPPYVTDLVVASTDANGKVLKVCLDDGATYNVASQQVDLERKDTLLRCMAVYTYDDAKNIQLFSLRPIFSSKSYPASSIYVIIDGKAYKDYQRLVTSIKIYKKKIYD